MTSILPSDTMYSIPYLYSYITSILQKFDSKNISFFHVISCFLISGAIPYLMLYVLHYYKQGWIVDTSIRNKHNVTYNMTLSAKIHALSMVTLTAVQAILILMYCIHDEYITPELYPPEYTLYTLGECIFQVTFHLVVGDFVGYINHRIHHENRWLYTHIHRIHHLNTEPDHPLYALFTIHPVEMFWSNMCIFAGFPLIQTKMYNILIFGCISSTFAGANHCSIILPKWLEFFIDPSFHHLHHQRMKVNYAEHFKFIDQLFGTAMEHTEEYKEERRAIYRKELEEEQEPEESHAVG